MQAKVCGNALVVSQDGRWIVAGEYRGRGKVTVWNAATRDKVLEITDHARAVVGVDISSDCTKIASADKINVRIYSTTSGIRLLPPLPHDHVVGVKFSPDGSRLATASLGRFNQLQLFVAARRKITCFDVSNSSCSTWSIHETHSAASIASNGRFIACSAGPSVSLWDCVSHKQIGSIITDTTNIRCIALSPSGGYLACGFRDGKVRVHNLRDVLSHKYFDHGLPLVQASDEALKSWTQDNPTNTEVLLSEEITSASSPRNYALANHALVRAHLKRVALAVEDAKESLQVQPSPIGYIAMAVALLGQGDRESALCAFDLAFLDCEPHDNGYLLLLKSILVFESGNQEEAMKRVEHLARRAHDDNDDEGIYLYAQARASHDTDMHVHGAMHMKQGNYGCAIPLIERAKKLAPKDKQCPPLETISLIFGWSFNGLDTVAQRRLCDTLYAEGRTAEAVEILLNIIRTLDGKIQGSKATVDWNDDFSRKCATTLEHAGDEAFRSVKHDDALTQYSTVLTLFRLFITQSRAQAAKGLWEDALQYANDAVKVDRSYPLGYEAKHVALHGTKRYDEAIDAFESMLDVIEHSHDPEIRPEATAAVDSILRRILEGHPLVVINIATGCLCDGAERIRIFKDGQTFKELVSSMTRELDYERIQRVVASFCGYVMFSHAWQGNEPLYQDVEEAKSVWNLPDTPLNEKLRNFCKEVRRLGHNWAWSVTCCIDKTTSSILNQSLTSMYKWYADSAATLVFLAGVAHPSKLGDLTRSFWMTRAWTLQELLAPKVMFFYDSEWKPYLGDTGTNHKESSDVMQELADAIKIPRGTIVTFSPDDLGVREKLRLASTRNATVKEDVAYSLIGIFKSDIRPHYGEGADALDISWRRSWPALARSRCLRGRESHRHTIVVSQLPFLFTAKLLTTLRHSKGKE
ncbi:hypothetical protein EDC04DRAFT_2898602 [Pisolithus marmoratus]|nr:hypothetical protein EDC04DRAFT_2898602 [Pisolithus marmoratus]